MNEWSFAAEIKSWWDSEFRRNDDWQLSRCEVERGVEGTLKRSDLSVLSAGVVRLRGELRLPDHPVADAWHPDNLLGAINKATMSGSRWAFTSDSARLLLIDTHLSGPPTARVVEDVELVQFKDRDELDSEAFLATVRDAWLGAINKVAPIITGLSVPPGMAPDAAFVSSLRALLSAPVAAIRDELNRRRHGSPEFEQRLVTWMVDGQVWIHVPEEWEAEILRVAKLTAYVFTTRLMFYEALRRSQPTLPALGVPEATAGVVGATFKAYFEEAKVKSGDYETLFSWDSAFDFALLADAAVPAWRRVIEHLAAFDLGKIGYDILGKMFERLIDPTERYRWGQHYTMPDVVDLMLSFGIPDGQGRVLDPACGGGTFLVRAYVRKRIHDPEKSHEDVLKELYGIDVSAFAASLATVNLAVQNLDFEDNYPLIAAKSFFQVDPHQAFMAVPPPRRVALNGEAGLPVSVEPVRAAIFNPPYVRAHELGEERRQEVARVLEPGHRSVAVPSRLHGLSNYHVYFWLHAAQFLEARGRLVLITAGEWLDSDYGALLQQWLLDHFVIECCIESLAEPWFSEARVGTVVTVARQCDDEDERAGNVVRFVLLRRSLRELYGKSTSEQEHLDRVDSLRDRILNLGGRAGESDDLDWSAISQAELRRLGSTVRVS